MLHVNVRILTWGCVVTNMCVGTNGVGGCEWGVALRGGVREIPNFRST